MLLITETQNAPITKPNLAVIRPPTLKLILLGIRFDRSYAEGTKFATMLIQMVAAKKDNAATTVNPR